jgi:hypothetical protein
MVTTSTRDFYGVEWAEIQFIQESRQQRDMFGLENSFIYYIFISILAL